MSSYNNIFALPIIDRFLIYAPLHHLAALVDTVAVRQLRESLVSGQPPHSSQLASLYTTLTRPVIEPKPSQGDIDPKFLGLLPTRGCNMACRYCDFQSPKETGRMSLELASDMVNWYMDEAQRRQLEHVEVHFFGGEPFCGPDVIDLAVSLARRRAQEIGCSVRFEAATNGVVDENRARWIAGNISTVVLSLDGPADIQNWHRPLPGNQSSFDIVAKNARIFSEGLCSFAIRTCITSDTVDRMEELAAGYCEAFRPDAVCFEPLQPTPESAAKGLLPPDPWDFARNFITASRILEAHGIDPVYATANINQLQVSFCSVGNDALIVSPHGRVDGCYLLRREWQAKGLNLTLGQVENKRILLDNEQINAVRQLNVTNKPLCQTCFAKWHCAGGCHVNHPVGESYDRLCIQNRAITLRHILNALNQDDLVTAWLESDTREQTIRQPSDRLVRTEVV